ncbi:uncharacterized protein LOC124286105 isoform X4 [Haliotis rubra]|uniref:uncharacterized protein LOC124286105 isoform X4 n=1 Tax=Haliotis rubra TaxID=36100 RepID=UPI001EE5FEB6|nr:uncharacterized protein LOC124286105 isoform X4 [Haliotis rubra]
MGNNNINRFSVSCNDTVHSIQFRFNSTTDQGGWQCGKLVNINHIYPRSNIQSVGVASPVMSTQSSSTTTRYTETTAESGTVTSQNDGVSLVTSTQSTQSLPTTTWYTETTIEPGTVTPQKVSTDDGDSDTIYIVVGAVGGAVLLAVVVVGIVCIRRRGQAAHHQNDMKEESNFEATPVYQNTISFHTVSDSSAAVTNPENTQQDDPIVSEDVNTQNMYESLTSVEMHIYRRLK